MNDPVGTRTFNRRPAAGAAPAPMRVRDDIILACRDAVENSYKRTVRRIWLPVMRFRTGAELGEGFQWGRNIRIRGARIGRYVFVGSDFTAWGPVSIGDLTMISTRVSIVGDDHVHDDSSTPMRINFPNAPRPTTIIEADCWIGHGAIIKEGTRIGRGAIVAAGAIVTKDVDAYAIAAGVPARKIRERFDQDGKMNCDRLMYGQAMTAVTA